MGRDTYSMHKHRHLAKPMMITSTSGHIVEIMGPYKGKVNDASIVTDDLARSVQEQADREEWTQAQAANEDMSSDEEIDFPHLDASEPWPEPDMNSDAKRLLDYQKEGDVDVLDRGYRDAIEFLKVLMFLLVRWPGVQNNPMVEME